MRRFVLDTVSMYTKTWRKVDSSKKFAKHMNITTKRDCFKNTIKAIASAGLRARILRFDKWVPQTGYQRC